jgi:hypothetical protein
MKHRTHITAALAGYEQRQVEETHTCGLCQPDVVLLRSKQVGTLPPKPQSQVEQMRLGV